MSMKPRIVREQKRNPDGCYGQFPTLCEDHRGPAYLALPWPESCPYTPEQVMAACERRGYKLVTVPYPLACGEWSVLTDQPQIRNPRWVDLTPEFMAEPKKCEHKSREYHYVLQDAPSQFCRCNTCGEILSDRRHGERRKGERRKIGDLYTGGRRIGSSRSRTYVDRRKP